MKEKVLNFIHSKNFIIVLIILLLLLVVVTATYAWFTWSSTENTSVTMSIGKASDVVFKTGNDISTNNLSPVFNYTDGEKTSFSIINRDTTGASLTYTINLNITTISEELKSNNLKYKLLQGSNVVNEGDFSTITNNSTITMYSDNLTTGTTNFTFYLYIDGNEENNLNMMNKSIVGNITVSAEEKTLASAITNLYTNAEKTTVTNNSITYNYDTTHSLMEDIGGNIRYYGASPNNYIYFNCSDYSNQSSSTCETWRIIGIFDGKVKIMRNEVIGSYSWNSAADSTDSSTSLSNNNDNANIVSLLVNEDINYKTIFLLPEASNATNNNWSQSSLMKLLNPGYESKTIGGSLYYNSGSGSCYSGSNNATTTCNFTSTGIKNDTTRKLISDTLYYLGGWNNNQIYSDTIYGYERGTTVYSGRPTTWTGKIALPYPSDYGYAADLGSCNQNLLYYDDSTCTSTNWMKPILAPSYGWLLTPYSGSSDSAWSVFSSGYVIYYNYTFNAHGVAPVLYLSSEQVIGSGTGTNSDPYRLSVS